MRCLVAPIVVAGIGLCLEAISSAAVDDATEIRGLATSGFYTASIARARAVLAEVGPRAPGSAEEAEALDLNLEVLIGSGLEYTEEARALANRALGLKERLWGRGHPQFARTLVLAARLRFDAAPGAAREMLERARSIQATSPVDDDPLADARYALVGLEGRCGNEDRSRELLLQATDILRPMTGDDPATAVRQLSWAAKVDPERCEERLSRLEQEIRRLFGPEHPLTARAIALLAICRGEHGQTGLVRADLERALAILRSTVGTVHPLTCDLLITLGAMYGDAMDSRRAESFFRQGIAACTGIAGEAGPLVRNAMFRFAWHLNTTERFDEGFEMATRAIALVPPETAASCPRDLELLAQYATMLRDRGDWAAAKALLEPVVERSDRATIGDSASYAEVLHHLGEILFALGDDERARSLLERSLAMRERVSGANYISNWVVLTDLGNVLSRLGELDPAEAHLERALELVTTQRGPAHGCVSTILRVIADVQVRRGDPSGARDTLRRALGIAGAAFGGEGGRTELILRDLCALEGSIGGLRSDRTTCARALGVAERRYGPHHPGVGRLLAQEAALSYADGDRKAALRLSLDAEQRSREHFMRTVRTLSEREGLSFELTRHRGLDVALSVLATSPDTPDADVRRVWSEVLRSRAMVTDESIARRRALAGGDPETHRLFDQLETARGRLSRAVRRSTDLVASAVRDEIEAAVAAVDSAERKWSARQIAQGGARPARADLEQVLAALPREAALVAYVRYRQLDRSRPSEGTTEYGALVARSRNGPAEFVPLGAAERIESLVDAWSRTIGADPLPGRGRPAESAYRETAAALREAIWDPVRARLGAPSFVLVVPDGPLHLVALGTLPSGEDRYVVETDPPIQLLSTERDVAALAVRQPLASGLLAVGDPAFDRSPGAEAFSQLPQAVAEVHAVRAAWVAGQNASADARAVVLTGADATEQAFKRDAPASRVIHLATHGFVLPLDRGWLTQAGLAFAGANRQDLLGVSVSDGILTLEEISELDLTRTEWVVLSACESGVGSVLDGEGVFGLRRAFRIAGARTTIMSLWEVRDDAARDWMGRLYRARVGGASTVSAVRAATLGMLEARRDQGLDTHPARWGAFVAVGDWR
jgi:CHAT domain-containing protein/tetratricopeptide (TPR) repeat protein